LAPGRRRLWDHTKTKETIGHFAILWCHGRSSTQAWATARETHLISGPGWRCAGILGAVKTKPRGNTVANTGGRALIALVAGLSLAFGGASPASAGTSHGSSGSFTLTGDVSGTLKVPGYVPGGATGCTITKDVASPKGWSEDFNFYGSRLTIDGKAKRVHFVDMEVGMRRLGQTYTLSSGANSPNSIYVSIGKADYGWNALAGTITTSKYGSSGSISGTLTAGTYQPGPTTIKGSWTGCEVLYVTN
jgi:hypothetical protein